MKVCLNVLINKKGGNYENVSPFIYVKDVDKSLCYYKDVFNAQTEILMGKDGRTYHAQLIIGDETFVHFSDTFHKHPVSKILILLLNVIH